MYRVLMIFYDYGFVVLKYEDKKPPKVMKAKKHNG